MVKPIEDKGHLIEATKPFKLKIVPPDRLPDPVQCAGSFIGVCNPADSASLYTVQSDGSRWRRIQYADEPGQAVAVRPADVDLTPMIQEAVRQALPAIVTPPALKVIQGPAQEPSEAYKAMAQAVLEMSEHVTRLQFESAELRAEVEFLKKHAVAKVDVRAG